MRSVLVGKLSLVQSSVTQLPVDTITLRVDSDHAGCLRTRRSTGIAVDHGKHVIKAASTTQTAIAFVKRRVRILRDCAWLSHFLGHEEHGQ